VDQLRSAMSCDQYGLCFRLSTLLLLCTDPLL
jgi:hypothetical protein